MYDKDEEFEKQVQETLQDLSFTPSPPVWDKIEAQLPYEYGLYAKRRARRSYFIWASVLSAAMVGGYIFFNPNTDTDKIKSTLPANSSVDGPHSLAMNKSAGAAETTSGTVAAQETASGAATARETASDAATTQETASGQEQRKEGSDAAPATFTGSDGRNKTANGRTLPDGERRSTAAGGTFAGSERSGTASEGVSGENDLETSASGTALVGRKAGKQGNRQAIPAGARSGNSNDQHGNTAPGGKNTARGGTNTARGGTNITPEGTNITPEGTNTAQKGTNTTNTRPGGGNTTGNAADAGTGISTGTDIPTGTGTPTVGNTSTTKGSPDQRDPLYVGPSSGEGLSRRILNSSSVGNAALPNLKPYLVKPFRKTLSPETANATMGATAVATARPKRWSVEVGANTGQSIFNDGKVNKLFTAAELPIMNNRLPPPGLSIAAAIVKPAEIKPGWSIALGADARYRLSRHLSITGGLYYNQLTTRMQVGDKIDRSIRVQQDNRIKELGTYYSNGSTNNYTNNYHFVEIPLLLYVQLNQGKKLPLYLNGGLSYAHLLSTDALHYDGSLNIYYDDPDLVKKDFVNVEGGFSARFFANNRIALLAGPEIQYGLTNLLKGKVENSDKHSLFIGFKVGVSF